MLSHGVVKYFFPIFYFFIFGEHLLSAFFLDWNWFLGNLIGLLFRMIRNTGRRLKAAKKVIIVLGLLVGIWNPVLFSKSRPHVLVCVYLFFTVSYVLLNLQLGFDHLIGIFLLLSVGIVIILCNNIFLFLVTFGSFCARFLFKSLILST